MRVSIEIHKNFEKSVKRVVLVTHVVRLERLEICLLRGRQYWPPGVHGRLNSRLVLEISQKFCRQCNASSTGHTWNTAGESLLWGRQHWPPIVQGRLDGRPVVCVKEMIKLYSEKIIHLKSEPCTYSFLLFFAKHFFFASLRRFSALCVRSASDTIYHSWSWHHLRIGEMRYICIVCQPKSRSYHWLGVVNNSECVDWRYKWL